MATHTTSQPETTTTNLQPMSWSSLSGRVLEGGFELQEMFEADDTRAHFKVRVLGDRDLDCMALLFQKAGPEVDQQVNLWSVTRQLRHPNVSAPLGAGRFEMEGTTVIYCVVRRADESLDSVLAERALTAAEAGEVLESVVRALEVLHLNDICFGCLSPSRVLAVGESIQLPVACVRECGVAPAVKVFAASYLAPESEGIGSPENISAKADLWCLGVTLFEALTQSAWKEELRTRIEALPEPFASIILRCLQHDPAERADLNEVLARYRGELKPLLRVQAAAVGSTSMPPALALPLPISPVGDITETEPSQSSTSVSEVRLEDHPTLGADSKHERERAGKDSVSVPVAANSAAPAAIAKFDSIEPAPAFAKPSIGETQAAPTFVAGPGESSGVLPLPHLVRVEQARGEAKGSVLGAESESDARRTAMPVRSSLDEALNSPVRRSTVRAGEDEPATNLWVWAAVLLLVVGGLIWALRPKAAGVPHEPSKASTAAKATTDSRSTSPAPKTAPAAVNAWQTQTLQPDGSVAKPVPAAEPSVKSHAPGVPAEAVWRVVAFTYMRREDAQTKVDSINAKNAALHAAVFTPSKPSGPFLVVLGGRMDREEAAQLRRRAVGQGMPRDAYIQNYSH